MGLHRGDQLGERLKAVVAADGHTSAAEAITTDHIALYILFEGFKSIPFIEPPSSQEQPHDAKQQPHA